MRADHVPMGSPRVPYGGGLAVGLHRTQMPSHFDPSRNLDLRLQGVTGRLLDRGCADRSRLLPSRGAFRALCGLFWFSPIQCRTEGELTLDVPAVPVGRDGLDFSPPALKSRSRTLRPVPIGSDLLRPPSPAVPIRYCRPPLRHSPGDAQPTFPLVALRVGGPTCPGSDWRLGPWSRA